MADRIGNFVNKFLAWPLPESVRPDDCVMDRAYPHRIGTNLLTATEARAMFEHALADDPVRAALEELVALKAIKDRAESLHFAGPLSDLGDGWEAEYNALRKQYLHRQPKAWDAARAVLGQQVPAGVPVDRHQGISPTDADGKTQAETRNTKESQ